MKYNGMRMLTRPRCSKGVLGPEASIGKLFWTTWHRSLGETAMDVLGADALLVDASRAPATYELDELQRIFMFSRAETIYAGASEIQRNIIGERVLGSPARAQVNRRRNNSELRLLRGARRAAARRAAVPRGQVARDARCAV